MGFFSGLKKAVKKAVNKVAEKVSDVIETAGNKAADAAKSLGNAIAQNVPVIGPALGAVVNWAGGVVSGICDLGAAAVKGAAAVISAGADLVLGVIGGAVEGDWALVKESLVGVVTNLVGGALIVLGSFVSLVQTVFGAQERKRKLTNEERVLLLLVFRNSLGLDNIRLIVGRSGVFSFNERPFTMGNIIYMKNTEAKDWNATLVHESVHVWQYQHEGSRYTADALGAQALLGTDRSYQWWREPNPWTAFNAEAQAEIFEDIYIEGELSRRPGAWIKGGGVFFADDESTTNRFQFDEDETPPATDYTPLAIDSTAYVRSQLTAR